MITSTKYKDEYLNALLEGNNKILHKIYREFAPEIRRYISSRGGNEETAKDIFQDAIETILFKLKKEEIQLTSTFKNYLFGICKYLWLNRARKIARSATEDISELQVKAATDTVLADGKVINEETAKAINRWQIMQDQMTKLSADCQKIYGLSLKGERGKSIGDALGKTVSNIRKMKNTCKQKLIALVQKDGRYASLW